MNSQTKNSIIWGAGGSILLLTVYFLILSLANSFSHALQQFQLLAFWMSALIIGFGIQTGLFVYIRLQIKVQKAKAPNKEMAATAGVSTGSMIACCAHHLIDVLPFLGLSAAFLFLAQYQILFIILGILSNVVGIILMLEIIKKHSLSEPAGLLERISQYDIKKIKYQTIAGSVVILVISFFSIKGNLLTGSLATISQPQGSSIEESTTQSPNTEANSKSTKLPPVTNEEGSLSIKVEPINFSFDLPVQFKISFDTHQGDLDFDLTRQSILFDNYGNQYAPDKWIGSTGGHHLSGTLVFPVIKEAKTLKLIINDVYNVAEREFMWSL